MSHFLLLFSSGTSGFGHRESICFQEGRHQLAQVVLLSAEPFFKSRRGSSLVVGEACCIVDGFLCLPLLSLFLHGYQN